MMAVTGRRIHQLMEVINGQLRVGTGMNMRINHSSNLRIMVMMIDEVDTEEDEAVAEDLEEGSAVAEVAAVTRMGIVVVMVVTMVATEVVVVAIMTVVLVKDTEAREVVVVASEDKMNPVVEAASEEDVVVKEVTAVMVDITEDSEAGNSIKNNHI